jgi:hypothetical protein
MDDLGKAAQTNAFHNSQSDFINHFAGMRGNNGSPQDFIRPFLDVDLEEPLFLPV